jgi:hypothetical protein
MDNELQADAAGLAGKQPAEYRRSETGGMKNPFSRFCEHADDMEP